MRDSFKIIFVFCLLGFTSKLAAQLIPNFGAQRAGLSTLSFLKNDISPRSAAVGGASIANTADGYSVYVNPAAVSDITSFNATISNYTVGAGIQQSYASVIIPRKNKLGGFGISLNTLNSGAMDVRTEFQPEGTGEKFYVTNIAAGITYSQKLSDMFSVGATIKYIYEQIYDYNNSTLAADVSFLYYTDFKDLKFAVMVQNFGGNSSISGGEIKNSFNRTDPIDPENYTVPSVFKLGASIVPWKTEKQSLLIAMQLNHPNDNAENYRLGFEYEYLKLLFIRTGLKVNLEGQKYPTFGFGLRHRVGGHPLQLDYAANPTEFLGVLHTLGLSLTLNNDKRE